MRANHNILKVCLVLLTLTFISESSYAQDSWWRKLFKKETVEEMEQQKEEPQVKPVEETPVQSIEEIKSENNAGFEEVGFPLEKKAGNISIDQDDRIASLDSAFRKNPPSLKGYRIQIYFGTLNTARSKRAGFISNHRDVNCYIDQNPPNFAVLVGDFRTELDAYRYLNSIKSSYTGAIIVPSEINNP